MAVVPGEEVAAWVPAGFGGAGAVTLTCCHWNSRPARYSTGAMRRARCATPTRWPTSSMAASARALAAQGFASADVIVAWPEIVGERLAALHAARSRSSGSAGRASADPEARPEPADPRGARRERLRPRDAASRAAVVERVNAHYGWRCIGRLVLKQGPVRRGATPKLPAATASSSGRDGRIGAAVGRSARTG